MLSYAIHHTGALMHYTMSSEQLAKFIVRMPRSAMLFTVHLVTDTQFHRFMANAMHRAAHSMKQTLVTFTQCTTLSHIYTAVHAKHLVTVSVGKKAATYSCFPQTHFPRPPPSLHVSHPSILSTLLYLLSLIFGWWEHRWPQ